MLQLQTVEQHDNLKNNNTNIRGKHDVINSISSEIDTSVFMCQQIGQQP